MINFDQRNQQVAQQYNAGRDINIVAPLSLTAAQQRRNRRAMLAKVRAHWIAGVLEQSLHGAALIELGLHKQPDAVANPWLLVLQESDQSARPLSSKTSITQVYDEAGGELLILGEPGSGKTTLLLELTRDLLNRAARDETHPLPVVFNLSSWAFKRQPLVNWLVEELNSKYQVPRQLGQLWISTDQMVLLLDGLDEVAEEHRAACIETINGYRGEHGLVSIVLCSRKAEYLAQARRVKLGSAVLVQPLTAEQIEEYLSSADERLEAARVVLRNDPTLQELATSPLMLSVITLAYAEKSVKDLQVEGIPTTRRQVFADYVERMLHRRGGSAHYSPQQTIHWLTWLAQQMLPHRQTEFYIERMQPDWLAKGQSRATYERLAGSFIDVAIGVLIGILVNTLFSSGSFDPYPSIFFNLAYGLFGGLIGGLISEGERRSTEKASWSWRNITHALIDIRHLRTGFLLGMIVFLIGALLTWLGFADPLSSNLSQINMLNAWIHDALTVGLVGFLLSLLFWGCKTANLLDDEANWSWRNIWRSLMKTRHIKIGLMAFLSVGLVFGLREGMHYATSYHLYLDGVLYGLGEGAAHGMRAGLIAILLSFLLRGMRTVIQPAEIIIWSWKGIVRSLVRLEHVRNSLIVGSSIVLSAGFGYGLFLLPNDLNYVLGLGLRSGLGFGFAVGLSYWLFIGLLGGLSSNVLEEHERVRPNQGIWRSARNSIIIGFLGGAIGWSVFVLNYVFVSGVLGGALSDWATGGYNTLDLSAFWSVLLLNAKSSVQCSSSIYTEFRYTIYTDLGCDVWGQGFTYGLIAGLVGGLLAWLLNGGRACIQHIILRILLWHRKAIAWNYPGFLDEAANRILLRKVGGGYIFVHRLLLEYFANLETKPGSNRE